jgi:hypothetical protein
VDQPVKTLKRKATSISVVDLVVGVLRCDEERTAPNLFALLQQQVRPWQRVQVETGCILNKLMKLQYQENEFS